MKQTLSMELLMTMHIQVTMNYDNVIERLRQTI